MSAATPNKVLGLRRLASALWLTLAWAGLAFSQSGPWSSILDFLDHFFFRVFGGFPSSQEYVAQVIRAIDWTSTPAFATYVAWATFLIPLGFVARIMARARVRSGGADPLERLRAWRRLHPRWSGALLAILPALWGMKAQLILHNHHSLTHAQLLPIVLAATLAQYAGARAAARAFLQPTLDPAQESRIEIGADEIVFDAVAVTREARAAVGAVAALSVAMVAFIGALPIATLFRDPRLFTAVGVYIAVAIASATLFRRASRVAVGADGVLVKGTSRTRFFAYRDLDEARVRGGDLELVRRDRVVMRLQLHGADAVRRDAVCARIRDNVARVKGGEHAVAAQLVASASKEQLARVASGGADYRAASLSREALWALIEGPAVDAASRKSAAQALAKTTNGAERARLRVAAERCADPHVRVALEEMAEGATIEDEPVGAGRVISSRT